MIRNILVFTLLLLVYKAVKTVVRSAAAAYNKREDISGDAIGEEMVLDPNCKTYLPKSRAIKRSINGRPTYFCSSSCAASYEERAGR